MKIKKIFQIVWVLIGVFILFFAFSFSIQAYSIVNIYGVAPVALLCVFWIRALIVYGMITLSFLLIKKIKNSK
jgi:hypothetical protein